MREAFARRSRQIADRYRDGLTEWYGKEKADKVRYAEAFEICEYGRRPDKQEIHKLFPSSANPHAD